MVELGTAALVLQLPAFACGMEITEMNMLKDLLSTIFDLLTNPVPRRRELCPIRIVSHR